MKKITYKIKYRYGGKEIEKLASQPKAILLTKLYGKQKGFQAMRILPSSLPKYKNLEYVNGIQKRKWKPERRIVAERRRKEVKEFLPRFPFRIEPLKKKEYFSPSKKALERLVTLKRNLRIVQKKKNELKIKQLKKRRKEVLLRKFQTLKDEKKFSFLKETVKGLPKATKVVLETIPKYLFNKIVYSVIKRGTPTRTELQKAIKEIDRLDVNLSPILRRKKRKEIIEEMRLR